MHTLGCMYRYDTDHEPLFRQESYFQYLFGVSEAGVCGAISLPTGAATLFVPNHGVDYEVFCGRCATNFTHRRCVPPQNYTHVLRKI
jgi:hypothetical protein